MSIRLSTTPKLTRVLLALTTLLALTACTVTSESDPVTDPSPVTAAPDYVALENAIETKIKRGVWLEGKEYIRAPDRSILIDMEGYERWAVGQRLEA